MLSHDQHLKDRRRLYQEGSGLVDGLTGRIHARAFSKHDERCNSKEQLKVDVD